MKPFIIGVGCAIAVLSASTSAVAQSIDVVDVSPHLPIYTVPTTVIPSGIRYPAVAYPYSQGYTIPVAPTSPVAPVAPSFPQTPSFIWPYSRDQPTPISPTHQQISSFIWPYFQKQTTILSSEVYPAHRLIYRHQNYPYSRSRTIYPQSTRSQVRIIYSYPTYPFNPFGQ